MELPELELPGLLLPEPLLPALLPELAPTPVAPAGAPPAELPAPEEGSSATSGEPEVGILYRRALELMAQDFEERTWKAFWRVVIDGERPRDVARELIRV